MKKLSIQIPASWETDFEIKDITDEDGAPVCSLESTIAHEVEGLGVISGICMERTPGYGEAYVAAIHDAQQYLDYLEQLDMPIMFMPETPEEYLETIHLAHSNRDIVYFVEQLPQESACIIHVYTEDGTSSAVFITVYVKDWHEIDEALDFLNEHLTDEECVFN